MKKRTCLFFLLSLFVFVTKQVQASQPPVIDRNNQGDNWEILFDGTNVEQWRGKVLDEFPSNGWKIENGLLFLAEKGGGDIVTKKRYGNFELVFEFNLTEEANSGIKYFVGKIVNSETGREMINGPEYQIIDDFNNKEIKNNPDGLSSTASAYLLYAPENKTLNPPGQWNTGRIISNDGKVEHWLNGVKVVEYERGSSDFLKRKAETKFKNDTNYGELESGYILLTDHSDTVYFKEIKIREI